MLTEQEIIEGCKQAKPTCQEALYRLYGPRMKGICLRYAKTDFEAEDVFQEAFVNVFQNIQTFRDGTFSSWMRRIFVNAAINNYRRNKKHYDHQDSQELDITVTIENTEACKRYSGVCLASVKVGPSPKWMQERLKAIGLRPINNIVDITNYIQHETGQPLHAFDYDQIRGKKVLVKTLPDGTPFTTLDEKERKLPENTVMISDGKEDVAIGGIMGGLNSEVKENTENILLESAYFNPVNIIKSSRKLEMITDASTRFEKGTDYNNVI